ncbi:MAG: stage III sporulation protein AE [Clostridia bacterium]|jgi:stage III sporulation protein AE|nr:stage III sporulation protein AE [Clostridia bacterium]
MYKFYATLILLLLIWSTILFPAQAQDRLAAEAMVNQLEELDLEDLETFLRQLDRDLSADLPGLEISKIYENLKSGQLSLDLISILQNLATFFFKELMANSSLLGKLIILAIIAGILQNIQAAFEEGTTGKMAYAVTYLALISIALASFSLAITIGKNAVQQMVTFIQSLLPVLLTLMAAVGGFTTVALLHPLVITAVSLLSTLTLNVIIPLIYFSAVLAIVNHISDKFQVSRLADLLRDLTLGLLGVFLTVFIGILTIQGVAGAVSDGIALRTAKFMTGSFVPVVGKLFADAVEAVAGTSLFLKNAVSLVGVMVIVLIVLLPAVKILTLVIIYRLAAALIQPFGEGPIAAMLQSLAGSLLLVFGAVSSVGLMFFIALAIIAGLGNLTVLLR